jgi:hypothetical protein
MPRLTKAISADMKARLAGLDVTDASLGRGRTLKRF